MDTSAGRDFVIALLGDVNVGKQSFLERYGGTSLIVVDNKFKAATISFETTRDPVRFNVWDIVGLVRSRSAPAIQCFKDVSACISAIVAILTMSNTELAFVLIGVCVGLAIFYGCAYKAYKQE